MERKTMVEMIEKAIREASELDPGMRITEDSSFMDDLEMASVEIFSMIGDLEAENQIRIPERKTGAHKIFYHKYACLCRRADSQPGTGIFGQGSICAVPLC